MICSLHEPYSRQKTSVLITTLDKYLKRSCKLQWQYICNFADLGPVLRERERLRSHDRCVQGVKIRLKIPERYFNLMCL